MKTFFMFIWQLPQNLAGLFLIKALGAVKHYNLSADVFYWYYNPKNWFSSYISDVSLGDFIVIKTHETISVLREYGHCKQSKRLGWLYLFIVGIPSVCNNLWDRYMHKIGTITLAPDGTTLVSRRIRLINWAALIGLVCLLRSYKSSLLVIIIGS